MEPGSTGDERVDATLAVLDTLRSTPVAGHVAIFERVHLGLQEVLADTESSRGAAPGAPGGGPAAPRSAAVVRTGGAE